MLAIGAVIGAGIFSSIGTAAAGEILPSGEVVRLGAGPALVLSFVLLGVVCGLAALCYAELAAMIPQAGSAYAYSYATLGELVAWIIGWDLILEYAVGNVAVAIAWSGYLNSLLSGFGISFPDWLTHGYRTALLSSDPAVHALLQTAPRIFGIPILLNLPAFAIVMMPFADAPKGLPRDGLLPFWLSVGLWTLLNFCLVGRMAHVLASLLLRKA